MNTSPETLKNRALELMIQARQDQLLKEEQDFLRRYLAEHPDAAREGEACVQLLDWLKPARVAFRPAHRNALKQRLEQLVSQDVLQAEGPAGAGFRGYLAELWLGAARGSARRRLALVRSLLAVAAGVMVGVLLSGMGARSGDEGLNRPNLEMAETPGEALGRPR